MQLQRIKLVLELKLTAQRVEIAEELARIEAAVDSLLSMSDVTPQEVYRVFLTGGPSFLPAVKLILESRFGPVHLRAVHEIQTAGTGRRCRPSHR